jgi:hypothetical protein
MKILATTLTLLPLFITVPVMAGSGHDHDGGHSQAPAPVTQPIIEKDATMTQQTIEPQQAQQTEKKDTITITIPAKGDKEYKVQLAKGSSFDYSWQTNKGELFFDFHGEPKGDTTGYFKTFEKDTKSSASGSLTAEFEGTHGWYWKNNNADPVVIILKVSGEYKRLDEEVSQKIAEKNANEKIASLIEKKKLVQSWTAIKASSVEKKVIKGRPEWLITYINKEITDTEKQKLYVFLTMEGKYIAANYTGK